MTDAADLADRVQDGDLRLYELEEHADHETAATARRLLVERETGADLSTVGEYTFEQPLVARGNIDLGDRKIDRVLLVARKPWPVAGR